MWPWEHLAFGYLFASVAHERRTGRRIGSGEAVAVAVGTVLPDLIDKPLSWSLGVLPSGLSLGHSLAFTAFLIATVLVASRRKDRGSLGGAFAVGYVSHLAGDVLYPVLVGGPLSWSFLLWPVVSRPSSAGVGFVARFNELLASYLDFLGTPAGVLYVGIELLLLGGAAARWFDDGKPGLSALGTALRSFRLPPSR